jgi:hypothetical protein
MDGESAFPVIERFVAAGESTFPRADVAALQRLGLLIDENEHSREVRSPPLETKRTERPVKLVHGFAERGWVQLPAVFEPQSLGALQARFGDLVREGWMWYDASASRYVRHDDAACEAVHRELIADVTTIVAHPVKPSYHLLSAYQGGANLAEHRDREPCEYTLAVLVDFSPGRGFCPSPLQLRSESESHYTLLFGERGDGVLFAGRRLYHRRPKLLDTETLATVLFHFVDASFTGPLI